MFSYSTKRISILVSFILMFCELPMAYAMLNQSGNLTIYAESQEKQRGEYTSPEGVIYNRRTYNRAKVKEQTRIEHIKQHFTNSNRAVHGVFLAGTDARDDVVQFIDEIFKQLRQLKINLASQEKIEFNYIGNGNIKLSGQEYKVIYGYNGHQHTCIIIPAKWGEQNHSGILTGRDGGTQKQGEELYGYKLQFYYTENNPSKILLHTIYPFGTKEYIKGVFSFCKDTDEIFKQLKQLKVNLSRQYIRFNNIGNIGLSGQNYKAIYGCNGHQHTCIIIPDDLNVQYNPTSTDVFLKDTNILENILKYGYKLIYQICHTKTEPSKILLQFSSPFCTWENLEAVNSYLSSLTSPVYLPVAVSLPLFLFYEELKSRTTLQNQISN